VAKLATSCGLRYTHSAITNKTTSAVQVALLSKYPIVSSHEIITTPNGRDRNILESTVNIDGHKLSIFVNHWKSKAKDGKESARVKSATILANYIKNIKNEYIILGDLNSRYNEAEMMEEKLNDTNGRTAINDVMRTYQNGQMVDKSTISKSALNAHINLWGELPLANRWNHEFYGAKNTLDHILLPRSLFDNRGIEYVDGTFGIFAPSYLLNRYGKITYWSMKKKQHTGVGYSDHLPIKATFTTTKTTHNTNKIAQPTVKSTTIETLYNIEKLQSDVTIDNAVVIWKRGNNAIIKQSRNGRGVILYKCANKMQEGGTYEILIHEIKSYNGLKEITNLSIVKQKNLRVSASSFLLPSSVLGKTAYMRQNEMFTNIQGVYNNKKLRTNNGIYSIYFQNRGTKPTDGDKIKILYAHLGYYKGLQLVIHDRDDFIILE
jgi:endonuclease/exonuclease/phosphatase family metal-dependent hydrolase